MYAGNCAYVFVRAGVEPPPGQHLCTVNPAGVIATDDGAQIWFDAKGYSLRGADLSQPHRWVLTMAVSEFDEHAGRALWHAFVPHVDSE